jgi:hypothetical protein
MTLNNTLLLQLIFNAKMMHFYKKFLWLVLLFYTCNTVLAQKLSYKTVYQELQLLQKQIVPDKRVAILKIEFKDTLQPVVVIRGETDLPDAKSQIIQYLTDKKISFIDSLRLLPDASLGDKTWALATLSVSNLRSLPDDASELVSQAMMGTPLKVLDYTGKWYRVQTPDHYIGWMDPAGLQLFSQIEMDRWKGSTRFLFNSISGYAYDAPGKRGEVVSDLVLGDLFEVESTVRGFLKIKFPDGRFGYVRKSDCISFDDWINLEPRAKTILSVAKKMMGSPYLWGGASVKAADCSGFVKLIYYSQGIILARDASQQARYGEVLDFSNMDNLQAADLLFFGSSPQRISHVGIYMGNGDFIHDSGRVLISSIDPSDQKYSPVRFNQAARRIIDAPVNEGIVKVKDHPWYSINI